MNIHDYAEGIVTGGLFAIAVYAFIRMRMRARLHREFRRAAQNLNKFPQTR